MACIQSTVVKLVLQCDGAHIRPRRAVFDGATADQAYASAIEAGWYVSRATMRTQCPTCERHSREFFQQP